MGVRLFTIGFAGTSAERFFGLLRGAGARRVIDVRLNNTSQLAGFAKRGDLAFFLRELGGIGYLHVPELAPTRAMLDAYRKQRGGWAAYERAFNALMAERRVERIIPPGTADLGCLLCSEKTPEHCHRRLVAEYLAARWRGVSVVHLV